MMVRRRGPERSTVNGKQWEKLFQGFSRRQQQKRERTENVRELVAWYDEQTQLVMALVREVVSERAAELERNGGIRVEVKWPSHPPINVDPDGPFMSFMTLALPDREVHLYSHRVGAGPPLIHFVVAEPETQEKPRKRLLGRPGCRLEQREGGGFLLRSVNGSGGTSTWSVDDLAYRAFELLLADS